MWLLSHLLYRNSLTSPSTCPRGLPAAKTAYSEGTNLRFFRSGALAVASDGGTKHDEVLASLSFSLDSLRRARDVWRQFA